MKDRSHYEEADLTSGEWLSALSVAKPKLFPPPVECPVCHNQYWPQDGSCVWCGVPEAKEKTDA